MASNPTHLGQILLGRQDITQSQLDHALEYQTNCAQPIGACLLALGYVSQGTLNRALRRQSWMKPCAACITCLMAPFSLHSFASEHHDSPEQWAEQQTQGQWSDPLQLSSNSHSGGDFLKAAAEAAWDLYQGKPELGEWQYSINKESSGYSVNIELWF